MKRDSPDTSFGDDIKRPRTQDKFELRILIPSKIAGSIIGKGGSNIQKLRTNNNANVRIPNCEGPERIMNIKVDNEKSLTDVVKQILPYISEEIAKTSQNAMQSPSTEPNEIRILIHQSIVGGIIGKGGSKVKELREKSGAQIKVYGTSAPQSTDRCVSVQGTNEKIGSAVEQIVEIIFSVEIRGDNQPYDPNNFDVFYAQEYGGFGSQKDVFSPNFQNRGRGNGNQEYNGRMNFMDSNDISRGQLRNLQKHSVRSENDFDSGNTEDNGAVQTTKVTIPKDMGGVIIGPRGSRIRQIRLDSNADIKISDHQAGSEERIITISGTAKNIQIAQYLLQLCVKQFGSSPYGEGLEGNPRISTKI